ncbi:MAG: EAL domain-containing protein, partial [Lachnospiraceae bacterium]
ERLRANALKEQELAGEIENARDTGQFTIYLQPQMNKDGEVLGAEALVRWLHPTKGLIMPGGFIGILEKSGMIARLDKYVWELACIKLREWKNQGITNMYISVNISPRDFYFLDIYKIFTELIDKYGIQPKNLKLEITETAIMMNLEKQLELIERLRNQGFIIEMDDFGSGYSSLNMLKDIKVDVIKIDMAFLGKTNDEMRAKKILKVMVELSKQLDMPAVVEGVETVEQVEFLKTIGCDIFQGYYFAKPMEVEAFEKRYM